MSIIDEALSANATIANGYDPGRGKPPAPKIAIVTCADPRLSSIEQMLGLAEGDVDMIRNFGTVIDDDAVRSLVLSTRLLGSREIMIINHTDCGMLRFTDSEMEERLRKETGRAPIAPARFYSFTDAEANTREQIQKARSHPWISPEVPVRGLSMTSAPGGSARCSRTGRPSLASKGGAAPARAARGRVGAELALRAAWDSRSSPSARVGPGLGGRVADGGRRCRVAQRDGRAGLRSGG